MKKQYHIPIIVIGLVVAITPLITNTYFCVKYLKPYKQQIVTEAEKQIAEGKDTLVLNQFKYEDHIPAGGIINKEFLFDASDTDICNYYAARYYGVKALYCIQADECQIEFDTDVEVMGSGSALDSNGEQVGKQIVNAKRPVVPMGNRIVLQIPKDLYSQVHYQLPEEVQGHVTQVIYREYGKEEIVDINQLKME